MSRMKTVRTSELIGAALDWAVAKAQGFEIDLPGSDVVWAKYVGVYSPTIDWSQGGPLIREHIGSLVNQGERWAVYTRKPVFAGIGETPLIAACRAIVAANLGDEVQIPAELLP